MWGEGRKGGGARSDCAEVGHIAVAKGRRKERRREREGEETGWREREGEETGWREREGEKTG